MVTPKSLFVGIISLFVGCTIESDGNPSSTIDTTQTGTPNHQNQSSSSNTLSSSSAKSDDLTLLSIPKTQITDSISVPAFAIAKQALLVKTAKPYLPAATTSGLDSNQAVNSINWFEALLLCNALSKANGLDTVYSYNSKSSSNFELLGLKANLSKNGFRLPTASEWQIIYSRYSSQFNFNSIAQEWTNDSFLGADAAISSNFPTPIFWDSTGATSKFIRKVGDPNIYYLGAFTISTERGFRLVQSLSK